MNPIVLVVAWFVINLVLKSSKEKRKIEEAKRRRESQLGGQTKDVKSTVDTSRETLRKELQRAMTHKQPSKQPSKQPPKPAERPIQQQRPQREAMLARESIDRDRKNEEIKSNAISVAKPMKGNRVKLNIKKDLVRGIIFSEILSEPKSMTNHRRSI